MATLPGARHYRVSARTDWPSISTPFPPPLSYLSRSLADRWSAAVDFTTNFLHSSRFSAFRSSIFHSIPVHSLMLSSHLPPPQTENFPFRRMSVLHRSPYPQAHPAVLPHLQCFQTPNMAQPGGCPQEALTTCRDTAADCGLRHIHRTEDIALLGTQKKKYQCTHYE